VEGASATTDRVTRQAVLQATLTSWRPCIKKCGALLAPESGNRYCDICYERLNVLLFGDAA
jgi:hypothetical protein